MNEIWKDIPGYNGKYQVSNYGMIRSFTKKSKGKTLKISRKAKGYYYAHLSNGVSKLLSVHRIVASCFLPFEEGKNEVNHKDFNPSNNRVDNLEWTTRQENLAKSYEAGRFAVGEVNGKSKFTSAIVRQIRSNEILRKDALKMGISIPSYYDIKNGRTWRHI